MSALPARPKQVAVGSWLLGAGAATLALAWAVGLDAVESNGARVFFVVVWSYLAWVAYSGGGWARWAIVAILAVTVWGNVNAPTVGAAVAALTVGEVVAKALAVAAFCLLMRPAARVWFKAMRGLAESNGVPIRGVPIRGKKRG